MAGYVTTIQAFVYGVTPSPGGEQFLRFLKIISCDFTAFLSFLIRANFVFLDMLNKDNYS